MSSTRSCQVAVRAARSTRMAQTREYLVRAGVFALVLVAGCKSKGADAVTAAESPSEVPADLSIDDYERMLAQNEADLRTVGVAMPGPMGGAVVDTADAAEEDEEEAAGDAVAGLDEADASPAAPKRGAFEGRDRCEMICELAGMTCELEAKICRLAADHPGEPRYENACARATADCDVAEAACRACAE